MEPCFPQGNIYIKMKLRVWRDRKCISPVCAKTQLTCAGRQNIPSQGSRYRAEKGNLCKLGWTYGHDTVLAQMQYLYQKESTGMERLFHPNLSKFPFLTLYHLHWDMVTWRPPQVSGVFVPTREIHFRFLHPRTILLTYRHDTVFVPRQNLYQKEATGMERLEMYFPSRCKNSNHLCGPWKYSISREAV